MRLVEMFGLSYFSNLVRSVLWLVLLKNLVEKFYLQPISNNGTALSY